MDGTRTVGYKTVGIKFSEFSIAQEYNNTSNIIKVENIVWRLPVFFSGKVLDDEWDEVSVKLHLQLRRKEDDYLIINLRTESIYWASAGLSFTEKELIIKILMNQSLCQLQGGLKIKTMGTGVCNHIPNAYNKYSELPNLQKLIFENWI